MAHDLMPNKCNFKPCLKTP